MSPPASAGATFSQPRKTTEQAGEARPLVLEPGDADLGLTEDTLRSRQHEQDEDEGKNDESILVDRRVDRAQPLGHRREKDRRNGDAADAAQPTEHHHNLD